MAARSAFADVEPGTLLIDRDRVVDGRHAAHAGRPPVDYAGQPADYPALRDAAERARGGPLTIIADASHSLGATLDGRAVGTLADLTS